MQQCHDLLDLEFLPQLDLQELQARVDDEGTCNYHHLWSVVNGISN